MARRSSTPWLSFIVLLGLLAAAGWGLRAWLRPASDTTGSTVIEVVIGPGTPGTDPDPNGLSAKDDPDVQPADPQPETPSDPVVPPVEATPEQLAGALDLYRRGLQRQEAGELVKARPLLSQSLASGLLPTAESRQCRNRLDAIAATLVFSREIHPGDPYAREYRVKPGEELGAIVLEQKLYVPYEGIMRINLITNDRTIQINQRLKLIQGPFDAIITKHTYTLDLYHHGMFVRSFRIGLGQNGSTPTGRWLVRDRVKKARWTPPAGSSGTRTLEWGDPGYPLGAEGFWIALDGMDRSNEMVTGFGIHGTNEPNSIGKQASLGCIRLGDDDIALVFDLLYPGKSTVEVRP